ncbi:MAG: hypothetical protein WA843_02465, partial [Candidatus Saccharimonadales bacterium]
MKAERLPTIEQSSPENIDRFMRLSSLPTDATATESTLLSNLVLYGNSIGYQSWEGHQFGIHATQERALGRLYGALYPDADALQTQALARCDAVAIRYLRDLGQHSDYDASGATYDYDKKKFDEASCGVAYDGEIWPEGFPKWESIISDPLVRHRVEQGMPRTMQLFLASAAIAELNSESDWRPISANRLYNLPAIWNLSAAETLAITQAASTYAYGKEAGIASIIAADNRLRERYSAEDGFIDIKLVGGEEKLLRTAEASFREFIRSNGHQESSREWRDIEDTFRGTLEQIFPIEQRKNVAFEAWMKNLKAPA